VALAEKAACEGVFNILTGNSSAIGKVLRTSSCVRRFTGSTEVGKILSASSCIEEAGPARRQRAVRGVRRRRYDAAVEGAIVSKYRNMGRSRHANRLLQDKIYDQFVEKLSKKVAAMKSATAPNRAVQGR
jgi:succinate-semialdehyde dehydrogenase/glutarate-semialdehyde dehydrogenase